MWNPKLAVMKPVFLFLLSSLLTLSVCKEDNVAKINSHITVMGVVYCDICSNNSFSRHSYFIPGVEVKLDCKFKAATPKTTEEITFSVKRSTNRYGVYKLEVPSVDGIQCAQDSAVESCQASLVGTGSSSSACNIPGYRATTDEIAIKSIQQNVCIYSLNALSYRPPKREITLCGN